MRFWLLPCALILAGCDAPLGQRHFIVDFDTSPITATPRFSLESGTYYNTLSVQITSSTRGASIYYTTNGSDPAVSGTLYSSATAVGVGLAESVTIRAIAKRPGKENSGEATATYDVPFYAKQILTGTGWMTASTSDDYGVIVAGGQGHYFRWMTAGGAWQERQSDPDTWSSAVSNDGSTAVNGVTGGYPYTVGFGGGSVLSAPNTTYRAVALTGDRAFLLAAGNGSQVYRYRWDGGVSYTADPGPTNFPIASWKAVAVNYNATTIVAAGTGTLYYSNDSGGTVSDAGHTYNWMGAASSYSGGLLFVVNDNGQVWRSADFGNNWNPVFSDAGARPLNAIASDDSGSLVFAVGQGQIWRSNNAGDVWASLDLPGVDPDEPWQSVDCDTTGKNLVLASSGAAGVWVVTLASS